MTCPTSRALHQVAWSITRPALLILALGRCVGADMVAPAAAATNMPAVGMSAGQFGFAVTARDWTYDQSFTPDLSSGTLQAGLVIAGYTKGTGQLLVTDATGTSVLAQSLAGNVAAGNNTVIHGTPPFHVRVTTSNYSGIISLGINAGTGAR